jgi:antitoxin MazE
MTIQIKKWGNSSAVRIPADVLAAANLSVDDDVTISHDGGKIIIEAVVRKRYDLNQMLAAVTPDMLHDPIDWGPPVGREIF